MPDIAGRRLPAELNQIGELAARRLNRLYLWQRACATLPASLSSLEQVERVVNCAFDTLTNEVLTGFVGNTEQLSGH